MNITESGIAVLALAGSLFAALLLILAWLVIQIAARWKLFAKAGEAGWKSLIPFYSTYTQYRITWKNRYIFWIWLLLWIVNGSNQLSGEILTEEFQFVRDAVPAAAGLARLLQMRLTAVSAAVGLFSYVLSVMSVWKLAKAFGRSARFAVGLFFLNPVFLPILAFGKSEYRGPQ